jgi:hypothetical protein
VEYKLSGIFKGVAIPPALSSWVSSYMVPYKRGSGNVFPLATSFSQFPSFLYLFEHQKHM